MKFKNKPNTPHTINGKVIWESRSVAVVGVIMLFDNENILHVLVSTRGPKMPDYQGCINLVAGYLDWNESATEAIIRECWEETGFNIEKHIEKLYIQLNDLNTPWTISTEPTNNLQNISMRFGLVMRTNSKKLPKLTTKYNECEGESENPMWMPISDIDKYDWAFNHNEIIKLYYNRMLKKC